MASASCSRPTTVPTSGKLAGQGKSSSSSCTSRASRTSTRLMTFLLAPAEPALSRTICFIVPRRARAMISAAADQSTRVLDRSLLVSVRFPAKPVIRHLPANSTNGLPSRPHAALNCSACFLASPDKGFPSAMLAIACSNAGQIGLFVISSNSSLSRTSFAPYFFL